MLRLFKLDANPKCNLYGGSSKRQVISYRSQLLGHTSQVPGQRSQVRGHKQREIPFLRMKKKLL